MTELKKKISSIGRDEVENYSSWEFEQIAPKAFPTGTAMDEAVSIISEVMRNIGSTMLPLGITKILSELRKVEPGLLKKLGFTPAKAGELVSYIQRSKVDVRTNYGTFSTIKLDRIDGSGKYYTEIPLINADHWQNKCDRGIYDVLILYTGSGRDAQAVGILTPKQATIEAINTARNKILGEP